MIPRTGKTLGNSQPLEVRTSRVHRPARSHRQVRCSVDSVPPADHRPRRAKHDLEPNFAGQQRVFECKRQTARHPVTLRESSLIPLAARIKIDKLSDPSHTPAIRRRSVRSHLKGAAARTALTLPRKPSETKRIVTGKLLQAFPSCSPILPFKPTSTRPTASKQRSTSRGPRRQRQLQSLFRHITWICLTNIIDRNSNSGTNHLIFLRSKENCTHPIIRRIYPIGNNRRVSRHFYFLEIFIFRFVFMVFLNRAIIDCRKRYMLLAAIRTFPVAQIRQRATENIRLLLSLSFQTQRFSGARREQIARIEGGGVLRIGDLHARPLRRSGRIHAARCRTVRSVSAIGAVRAPGGCASGQHHAHYESASHGGGTTNPSHTSPSPDVAAKHYWNLFSCGCGCPVWPCALRRGCVDSARNRRPGRAVPAAV
ncbi:hypothetical protein SAMN04487905_108228 [Actinopolyspora xinjiangensis]|uniref:Uncharacterized protein n=1 Tax=Actinopolyspora xinjiangensis TaxID=405564 RepID=A0A1H0VEV8_9ACTN|nr:hypothetical protein SAMN04487905_108228 [Actinopolyspora xinjiangensis]